MIALNNARQQITITIRNNAARAIAFVAVITLSSAGFSSSGAATAADGAKGLGASRDQSSTETLTH
jgi:hypothetical protein